MRFVLYVILIISEMATSNSMNILIFGGNGFIGSHVVERLLNSGHQLTLISRSGTFSWDTAEKIQRKIRRHLICDRSNPKFCDEEFWQHLDRGASNFDAIIDFSAYKLKNFVPFYERLTKSRADDEGNRLLYIYISTDSVYEVCNRFDDDRLLKEIDSVRPSQEEERMKLARGDSYGDRKLEIEEYLIDQRRNYNGLPYTILRLPDVLGERDSTQRWWKYQLWLRYGNSINRPVQVPTFAQSLKTSYVDVKDVGTIIESILNQRPKSEDQIFNVGFENALTSMDLLTTMKSNCDAPDGSIIKSSGNDQEIMSYFPSVTRGGMDISKAMTQLDWRPSMDFDQMVQRISKFYLEAESKFEKEMMETAHGLMRDLRLSNDEKIEFLEALQNGVESGARDPKRRKITDEF